MKVGKKIKLARTLKELTQKELSHLVNLSYDRVRQYESDVRTPRENQLKVFSDALGFPLYFLPIIKWMIITIYIKFYLN